ncbi:Hypothetical protein SRAE_1000082900 [Strongyloides ratti]|uniref:Uncharacterized protein n=1 Tax=Strongyloides ratti TaxID=34506 RepID=A0A090L4Y8_STRRB|nr:Hypothetical protein SRAE_1000082900 [Strongyloides ratti]CEF62559.1 Hypothetical protein SRAE_1000082900 [Strongyloides ratti]
MRDSQINKKVIRRGSISIYDPLSQASAIKKKPIDRYCKKKVSSDIKHFDGVQLIKSEENIRKIHKNQLGNLTIKLNSTLPSNSESKSTASEKQNLRGLDSNSKSIMSNQSTSIYGSFINPINSKPRTSMYYGSKDLPIIIDDSPTSTNEEEKVTSNVHKNTLTTPNINTIIKRKSSYEPLLKSIEKYPINEDNLLSKLKNIASKDSEYTLNITSKRKISPKDPRYSLYHSK